MPIKSNPQGAVLGAPLGKENATDKSGTHYDFNGVGGYFGVPTLADLYTIPCDPATLNEDGFSSGQRRLAMKVRIMTTVDRGREFVLEVPGYENMTGAQQIAALCDNTNFVEQSRNDALGGVTGDVTFSAGVATIGAGKVTAAKIADALKSPAATVEGLRRLGTGANEAAPGSALAGKQDKVSGYGLSQQNYTAPEKNKLALLPDNPVRSALIGDTRIEPNEVGELELSLLKAEPGSTITASAQDGMGGKVSDTHVKTITSERFALQQNKEGVWVTLFQTPETKDLFGWPASEVAKITNPANWDINGDYQGASLVGVSHPALYPYKSQSNGIPSCLFVTAADNVVLRIPSF